MAAAGNHKWGVCAQVLLCTCENGMLHKMVYWLDIAGSSSILIRQLVKAVLLTLSSVLFLPQGILSQLPAYFQKKRIIPHC